MLIAQITDLHLKANTGTACRNTLRLRDVLSELKAMRERPDLILMTGDLSEDGSEGSYAALEAELSKLPIPTYLVMGNHDNRQAIAASFPNTSFNEGFLHYSLDGNALRIITLDTTEPGRHGGAFCNRRIAWLKAELAKAPEQPTLIAMHHPPTDTGIPWLTTPDEAPWADRFRKVIRPHKNIVQIICGHIHRPIFKRFETTAVSVANAVAPQVALDLSEIDPDVADGRLLIEDNGAGYALHHWDGKALTTHNLQTRAKPIMHYDKAHAHIVSYAMDRK